MYDGHHLAADRDALDVGVEDRKEDADALQRPLGQVQLGRWHRLLDEADQPVGGGDDDAGTGGRHPRRVAEERRVRTRGQQAGATQPPVASTRGGDRETCADERQAGAVHRGNRGFR